MIATHNIKWDYTKSAHNSLTHCIRLLRTVLAQQLGDETRLWHHQRPKQFPLTKATMYLAPRSISLSIPKGCSTAAKRKMARVVARFTGQTAKECFAQLVGGTNVLRLDERHFAKCFDELYFSGLSPAEIEQGRALYVARVVFELNQCGAMAMEIHAPKDTTGSVESALSVVQCLVDDLDGAHPQMQVLQEGLIEALIRLNEKVQQAELDDQFSLKTA
jgi:hypothetical protein